MTSYRRLFLVIAFFVLLLVAFEWSGLRQHLSLTFLRETFSEHKVAGLLIFTALFIVGNLLHVPGSLFLVAAVLALGELRGGLVTYVAAVVTCAATFWIIRLIGGDALSDLRFKWARQLLSRLHARPVAVVTALRVMMQTMPTLNGVLALSGIPFRSYMLGTVLGLPLPIALYCLFFDYLAGLLGLPGY